jgi:plasmanylethanolamine desaturase
MTTPTYSKGQRLLEIGAMLLFLFFAVWSLARLAIACLWQFPLVVFLAAPIGWLAVDLLSGLLHWTFDSFGSTKTPLIGQAFIQPFRAHHADPEEMTQHDFVETHGASCIAALPFLLITSFMPLTTWPLIVGQAVLLFIALGALATNQCHKWAHMDEAATPQLVRWAQDRRIVLPRQHHQLHHTAPFDTHFCMSNGWLNAPLNTVLRAWR